MEDGTIPDLISLEEAAKEGFAELETLYKWHRENRHNFQQTTYRFGRSIRVSRAKLRAWLEDRASLTSVPRQRSSKQPPKRWLTFLKPSDASPRPKGRRDKRAMQSTMPSRAPKKRRGR